MGKTLTFWLLLLFRPSGIQIVITPLNQLGQQNMDSLCKAGISSIAINADTATLNNFCAIENLKYRAIVISPEQLMKPRGGFEKLFLKPEFTMHLIGFVFDEEHCVCQWGEFRPEYKELQWLHYILWHQVPYLVASATLTSDILCELKKLLYIHTHNLLTVQTSIDQPNLALCVCKIKYSLALYADLGFLIPINWKEGDPIPKKFLIFFNNIQDAINVAKFLQN
ncbi:hypothetical protein JVT61DRAFT_6737 [Boletus reticuloceps]|uniref:DNA 3'-5' helicase n=1 Tax=Boletus reticuloceps TaxID=495285 RepID=A0A8I3A7M1_9AGAM|nr:hypothetical protein JVT61DRAFT_6737 [Boletus reticuloceps]